MEAEYYKTKESVEEYVKLAKDVSGKQLIDKLKQILSPDSILLEIGSGPGTDWRILNESYNVIGSDNSIEFLNHLINKNPNVEFLELDAVTLKTDKKFDGIYSNKVMHHLKDEELSASLLRQHEILNSEGVNLPYLPREKIKYYNLKQPPRPLSPYNLTFWNYYFKSLGTNPEFIKQFEFSLKTKTEFDILSYLIGKYFDVRGEMDLDFEFGYKAFNNKLENINYFPSLLWNK